MGWGKPFSKNGWLAKVGKVAAVIAGTAVGGPAGGAAAGALVGSLGGKSSGGGLKGALQGGITGGLGGLLAGGLGSAAGSPLAGGIGPTMGSGIKGLLTGGGSNLGSILTGAGSSGLFGGLGSSAGSTLAGGIGPTQGSGLSGLLTRGISGNMNMLGGSGVTSLLGGGSSGSSGLSTISSLMGGGSGGGFLNPLTSLLSGGQQYQAQGKEKDELMQGQAQAMGAINPYLESGGTANTALTQKLQSGELGGTFNPGDLTEDPGYKFRLQQGEQALGRRQSAGGNYFSGRALKEAQDYGQGIADQTYNEAHNRWLKEQQNTYGMLKDQSLVGLDAAGAAGDIYTNQGNIRANATQSRANTISSTLASLLGGGRQQFYDEYGNPVYA